MKKIFCSLIVFFIIAAVSCNALYQPPYMCNDSSDELRQWHTDDRAAFEQYYWDNEEHLIEKGYLDEEGIVIQDEEMDAFQAFLEVNRYMNEKFYREEADGKRQYVARRVIVKPLVFKEDGKIFVYETDSISLCNLIMGVAVFDEKTGKLIYQDGYELSDRENLMERIEEELEVNGEIDPNELNKFGYCRVINSNPSGSETLDGIITEDAHMIVFCCKHYTGGFKTVRIYDLDLTKEEMVLIYERGEEDET